MDWKNIKDGPMKNKLNGFFDVNDHIRKSIDEEIALINDAEPFVDVKIKNIKDKYNKYNQIYKDLFGSWIIQLSIDIINNDCVSNVSITLSDPYTKYSSEDYQYVSYAIDNFKYVLDDKGYQYTNNIRKFVAGINEIRFTKCVEEIYIRLK